MGIEMRRILFALAMVIAGLSATTPKAYAIGDFTSGNWRGYAVIDNGRFSLCRMSAGYSNGYSLVFAISGNGRLLFSVAKTDWNYRVGSTATIRIQIDNNAPVYRTAEVVDKITVASVIDDRVSFFNSLRYGNRFAIEVGNIKTSFTLQGTYNALQSLLACAARYR